MEKEKCIRCGRETEYEVSTPVTMRRYYVEGSGQLCLLCYQKLYGVAGSLQNMYERDLGKQLGSTNYSKIHIDPGSVQE